MRKVFLLAAFIICCTSVSFAQDKPKVEVFGGFSVSSIDTGLRDSSGGAITNADNRENAMGFETSVTGFVNNKFGIEGDFDGHFKNKTFIVSLTPTSPAIPVETKISTYNFMAGPHVRFANSDTKVTPFLHALFGGNHSRVNGTALGTTINDDENDFAMKFGGGVDFDVHKHAALRLAADYNPVFERNNNNTVTGTTITNGSRTRNDFVFSVGVVLK